jgi:hypothetical protein
LPRAAFDDRGTLFGDHDLRLLVFVEVTTSITEASIIEGL